MTEKMRAYKRKQRKRYYAKHRDEVRARAREDYWRNHDKNLARHRKYNEEHREELRRKALEYKYANLEKIHARDKIAKRRRYHADPERFRAQRRKWYYAHREEVLAKRRQNLDKNREYSAKWRRENPESYRACAKRTYQKHRAKRLAYMSGRYRQECRLMEGDPTYYAFFRAISRVSGMRYYRSKVKGAKPYRPRFCARLPDYIRKGQMAMLTSSRFLPENLTPAQRDWVRRRKIEISEWKEAHNAR